MFFTPIGIKVGARHRAILKDGILNYSTKMDQKLLQSSQV